MPANVGPNQYFDFKGFQTPFTPAPLQQMFELAKANKAAETEGMAIGDEFGTHTQVQPGPDTEAQRAFEAGLQAKADQLTERYMRREIDPNQFAFEVKRLKAFKENDLDYKNRVASYQSAGVANQSLAKLGMEGKLGPGDDKINYLNHPWDSKSNGVFQPRPEAYVPYDYTKGWEDIIAHPTYETDEYGQLAIKHDQDGTPYYNWHIDQQAATDRAKLLAQKLLDDSDGRRLVQNRINTLPEYMGMSLQEAAVKMQMEYAKTLTNNRYDIEKAQNDLLNRTNTDGTNPKVPQNNGIVFPGEATRINPFEYQLSSGAMDTYGDEVEDLSMAPMAFKNAYKKLSSHIIKNQDGEWVTTKDGTPADPRDVANLNDAENKYRFLMNNQTEMLFGVANELKSNGIRIETEFDDMLNQNVATGWTDVYAENQRAQILSQKQTAAKTYLSKLNKGQELTQAEMDSLGLNQAEVQPGTGRQGFVYGVTPELKGERLKQHLQDIIKDKEAATKYLKDLDKNTYAEANPSAVAQAFRERLQHAMDKNYQGMIDGSRVAQTEFITFGPGREEEDKMFKKYFDDDMPSYDQYYDPHTGKRLFTDSGEVDVETGFFNDTEARLENLAKRHKGLTIDPNTQEVMMVVDMAPKGLSKTSEPKWDQAKKAHVKLGDFGDQILQSNYADRSPAGIKAIKDYASQIGWVKNYGYGGKGTIELNDGSTREIVVQNDGKTIRVKEYDPFKKEKSGKFKTYNSLFDMAADFEKQETQGSNYKVLAPALDYAIAGMESNFGKYPTNSESSAAGDYHFLTSEDSTSWKMIQKFAKEQGYDQMTKASFIANRPFQKKFLHDVWLPTMYKEVDTPDIRARATAYNKWAMDNGKPIVSYAQLIALNHYQGIDQLRRFLTNPKAFVPKGTKNAPMFEYLDKINKHLEEYDYNSNE